MHGWCRLAIYGVLALAQPNRMRKRYVWALYLSAGFGDLIQKKYNDKSSWTPEVGIVDISLKNIINKGLGVSFMTAAFVARENGHSLLMQAAFVGIGMMFIMVNSESE